MTIEVIEDFNELEWDIPADISNLLSEISQKIWEAVQLSETFCWENWFWIMTVSWKEIWEIYTWKYTISTNRYNHIWIEIHENFRRKWIWKYLYSIWQEFWNNLIEEEYTRQYAKINFLIELWYTPVSLIHDDTWEENEFDWNLKDERIWNWYSCKLVFE